MFGIKDEKNALRKQYRQKRTELSDSERTLRDGLICRAFLSSISYRYCNTLLLYAATDGEPDVSEIAKKALEDGKKVAYPKCESHGVMSFCYVSSLEQLKPGAFGIPEPGEDAPEFSAEESSDAVCLIPGVVFDRAGYRVGYGRGYYDRYLSRFKGSLIGIAYSDSVIDKVPRGRFDAKIPVLLTEGGFILT